MFRSFSKICDSCTISLRALCTIGVMVSFWRPLKLKQGLLPVEEIVPQLVQKYFKLGVIEMTCETEQHYPSRLSGLVPVPSSYKQAFLLH